MTYQEATEYLFEKTANFEKHGASGYKVGLGNILKLDEHFGHPHKHFRSIHVGGTNGKGSVSHTIASMLQVCGYKVGLYTSPHIVDFSERIRINGKPISKDYVIKFVENEQKYLDSIGPSFFEIATAMAFKYFKEQDIDIAVIEVGLGGRLDSTNIITPILSVITNVSLEHTQLLGNTVEQIAKEKAGIMKHGVPCVIGEASPELHEVFDAAAQECGCPVVYAEEPCLLEKAELLPDASGFQYSTTYGVEFKGELQGSYQEKNTNTILHAFRQLMKMGYLCESKLPENIKSIQEEINRAFLNVSRLTGLMGRWQVVKNNPTVVCDTGHNVGAWQYLSKQLAQQQCRELRIVMGILEDKDIYAIMSLLPKNAHYYWTKGNSKRAFPETSLKVFGEQFGLHGDCYSNVEKAYQAACNASSSDDFIFIGGSTYVVADFLKKCI